MHAGGPFRNRRSDCSACDTASAGRWCRGAVEVCTLVLLLSAEVGGADGRKDLPLYWRKFRSSFIGKRILACICNTEEADRDAQLDALRNELGEPLASSDEAALVLSPPPEPQAARPRATTVFMDLMAPNQPDAPEWYNDALNT